MLGVFLAVFLVHAEKSEEEEEIERELEEEERARSTREEHERKWRWQREFDGDMSNKCKGIPGCRMVMKADGSGFEMRLDLAKDDASPLYSAEADAAAHRQKQDRPDANAARRRQAKDAAGRPSAPTSRIHVEGNANANAEAAMEEVQRIVDGLGRVT
jgi:hypothetical protein